MYRESLRLSGFPRQVLALLILIWCGAVHAQVPHLLNYQGFLTTPGGTPINTPVAMTIRLYDVPSGGAALYTETQPSVAVNAGVFNVVIGSVAPLALPFDVSYWLSVAVGPDAEMSPRQQVTASGYALRAANADALASGGTAGQVLTGTGGVPAWSGSPALSGNLTLVNPSTATTGNIMKGANPFIHNFGSLNTFIGENAGNFTLTGTANTVSGAGALASNTSGNFNTASGRSALATNTTGDSNSASGSGALQFNTTGFYNTATGYLALQSNAIGYYNSAVGGSALRNNTDGNNNSAIGVSALQSNTIGGSNSAIGDSALRSNTNGNYNSAIGVGALQSNTTGSYNIGVGINAGFSLSSGDHNIDIGNAGVAGESGVIRIGTLGSQFLAYIIGIYNAPALASGAAVFVEPDGRLGTNPSSRRYKDDIADMDAASSALMKLRPVTFHYKNDHNPAGRTLQYGLVAEEVAAIYPGLVARSADGRIEAVMYQFLAPMLLNEYQKQQRTIEAQAALVAELERDRLTQMARISALEMQASDLAALKQQVAQLTQLVADRAQLAAN